MEQVTEFETDSPIDCKTLQIFGVVYTIIFLAAIIANSNLIWIYFYQNGYNTINLLVVTVAFLNLFGALLESPFVILNQFHCR